MEGGRLAVDRDAGRRRGDQVGQPPACIVPIGNDGVVREGFTEVSSGVIIGKLDGITGGVGNG